jgi:hypothetical protein
MKNQPLWALADGLVSQNFSSTVAARRPLGRQVPKTVNNHEAAVSHYKCLQICFLQDRKIIFHVNM